MRTLLDDHIDFPSLKLLIELDNTDPHRVCTPRMVLLITHGEEKLQAMTLKQGCALVCRAPKKEINSYPRGVSATDKDSSDKHTIPGLMIETLGTNDTLIDFYQRNVPFNVVLPSTTVCAEIRRHVCLLRQPWGISSLRGVDVMKW